MSTTEATNVNPNLRTLVEAGTSPWLDFLSRSLVQDGELAQPSKCLNPQCRSTHSYQLIHNRCALVSFSE